MPKFKITYRNADPETIKAERFSTSPDNTWFIFSDGNGGVAAQIRCDRVLRIDQLQDA